MTSVADVLNASKPPTVEQIIDGLNEYDLRLRMGGQSERADGVCDAIRLLRDSLWYHTRAAEELASLKRDIETLRDRIAELSIDND